MAEDQLSGVAEMFGSTFASLVSWLVAWWTGGRDPGLGALRQALLHLWPVVRWVSAAVLAMSLSAAGVLLMTRRRGTDLAALVLGLARFLLVSAAGWLVLVSAWSASDALARWILAGSADPDQYRQDVTAALQDVEPVLALTLSVAGIASCLLLVAVILARFALALLLTVTLPVMAAVSVTRSPVVLRRAFGWLLAVLAFRPLAFLVYRAGQQLHSGVDDALLALVIAVVTFGGAAMVLPLTVRALAGRAG